MGTREIVEQEKYPAEILAKLQTARNLSISIANRWMLGWPERVAKLLEADEYWATLTRQTETEIEAIAENAVLANNLAPWEFNEILGLDSAPPML
jgi:hypothetical protein